MAVAGNPIKLFRVEKKYLTTTTMNEMGLSDMRGTGEAV